MACTIDFRCLDEGFGGKTYKRKREQQSQTHTDDVITGKDGVSLMDTDETVPPPAKRSALTSSENPDKPVYGQPSYDGVIAGKVSGRKWKQVRQRRASATQVSRKGTTFEQREREKMIKKAYKERMMELKEEIRLNKVEKRKKREEREKKKKENILKSGTKFQKITNPNTLKKIAKSKNRKQLRVVRFGRPTRPWQWCSYSTEAITSSPKSPLTLASTKSCSASSAISLPSPFSLP